MNTTKFQELAREIKKTLEAQTCVACNHRRASVTVQVTERGPQLKISCCCYNFEKKLRDMASQMWQAFLSNSQG